MKAEEVVALRAGMTINYCEDTEHILDRPKEDGSGWWLCDGGGVHPKALLDDNWRLGPIG